GSTCAQFNQSLNCQMDSISISCGAVAPMLARSCTIACSVSVYTPPTTIGAFGSLGWQSTSEPPSWATFNLTSYINPPDVPLEPDARRILAQTGLLADSNLKSAVSEMALLDSVVAAATDIGAVESGRLFGTRLAGNTPLFNSTKLLRIGWS